MLYLTSPDTVSLFDKRVNAYSGFLLIFHKNLALTDGKTRRFYLIKQTSADVIQKIRRLKMVGKTQTPQIVLSAFFILRPKKGVALRIWATILFEYPLRAFSK